MGIPGLIPGFIPSATNTTTFTSLGTLHLTSTVTVTATTTVTSSPPAPPIPKWLTPRYEVISYLEAAKYPGQRKTVEGTIVKAYRADLDTVFLNFHDPDRGYLRVVIYSNALSKFSFTPEVFYSSKEVRVSGVIQSYGGSLTMIVESPSQIEVAYMGFSYP